MYIYIYISYVIDQEKVPSLIHHPFTLFHLCISASSSTLLHPDHPEELCTCPARVSLPALEEEDQFLYPGFSVVGSLESMSAVMAALSGSKDMPPFGSEMDKEKKRDVDGGETSEAVEEEEEKPSGRFSSASVASSDAHEEDEEEEDGGHEIVLGPQVPLKEQLEMDKVCFPI